MRSEKCEVRPVRHRKPPVPRTTHLAVVHVAVLEGVSALTVLLSGLPIAGIPLVAPRDEHAVPVGLPLAPGPAVLAPVLVARHPAPGPLVVLEGAAIFDVGRHEHAGAVGGAALEAAEVPVAVLLLERADAWEAGEGS